MGLEITILQNLPPKEIRVGNSFVIGVQLVNAGAFEVVDGKLTISGFDPLYIEVNNSHEPILLKTQ